MLVERAAEGTVGFDGSDDGAPNGLMATFVEGAELKSPVLVANGFEVGAIDKDALPGVVKGPGAVAVAPLKPVAVDTAKGLASGALVAGPADEA